MPYNGKVAGEVRSAGGQGLTAGNVTFVNVYEAGCTSVLTREKVDQRALGKFCLDADMMPEVCYSYKKFILYHWDVFPFFFPVALTQVVAFFLMINAYLYRIYFKPYNKIDNLQAMYGPMYVS